jgi:hypothetical protein
MRADARRAEGRQGMTSAMELVARRFMPAHRGSGLCGRPRYRLREISAEKGVYGCLQASDLNHACLLKQSSNVLW